MYKFYKRSFPLSHIRRLIKPVLILSAILLTSSLPSSPIYSSDEPAKSYFDSFEGYSTTRYRLQNLETDKTDIDMFEYLSLSLGDLKKDRVKWHFFGSLRTDLDGANVDSIRKEKFKRFIFPRTPVERDPVASRNPFFSIDDSIEDGTVIRPYEFYADIAGESAIKKVRIGRQYIHEIENLHVDGIKVEFNDIKGVRFGMFGGKPVHFFETSSEGDYLSGTFVEFKPLDGLRIKMDYSYVNDNNDDFGGNGDNFFNINIRQNIKGRWNIYADFSMLDEHGRDLELRSSWVFPENDFDISVAVFKQLNTLQDFTIEFDDYNAITGDYFPYTEYSLNIFKGINKNISIGTGFNIRELNEAKDEGLFNHEYRMYYATLSVNDLPFKGTSINISTDFYETDDNDTKSLSVNIKQEIGDKIRLSSGTHYSLFKYDNLSKSERDNVRTYFLNTKYHITKKWDLSLDYEFERTGNESFHTVESALKYSF